MILWWMHQSAKLNVFLGVRNLNEEFLPEHLAFLKGFLNKKPMNLLFPFSVTISTVIAVLVQRGARRRGQRVREAGYTFLAADGAGDPRALVAGAADAGGGAVELGLKSRGATSPSRPRSSSAFSAPARRPSSGASCARPIRP